MKNGKTYPKDNNHYDVMTLYPQIMEVEKIDFPIENVERLVDVIIKLSKETKDNMYNTHIMETISILNNGLKSLIQPQLIIKGE